MAGPPNRADDDRVLRLIALRRGGATLDAAAQAVGISRARVAQLTDPVRAADMAESGEPPERVARAYWPVRQRRARDDRG